MKLVLNSACLSELRLTLKKNVPTFLPLLVALNKKLLRLISNSANRFNKFILYVYFLKKIEVSLKFLK